MSKWRDWREFDAEYIKLLKKRNAFERKHYGKHNMDATALEKFAKIEAEVRAMENHPERPPSGSTRAFGSRFI